MNLTAREALEKKRLKFAKVGILIGLGAGVAYGFQGIVLGQAGGMFPFADPSYGLWLICVASLVMSGCTRFLQEYGRWFLIQHEVQV